MAADEVPSSFSIRRNKQACDHDAGGVSFSVRREEEGREASEGAGVRWYSRFGEPQPARGRQQALRTCFQGTCGLWSFEAARTVQTKALQLQEKEFVQHELYKFGSHECQQAKESSASHLESKAVSQKFQHH